MYVLFLIQLRQIAPQTLLSGTLQESREFGLRISPDLRKHILSVSK